MATASLNIAEIRRRLKDRRYEVYGAKDGRLVKISRIRREGLLIFAMETETEDWFRPTDIKVYRDME